MATITLGNVKPAGYVHAGLNALVCKVSLSVSWSSGDVHIIGKLPRGALVLDTVFYPGAASPVTFIGKFGTSKSQEMFFVSDSWADVATLTRNAYRMGSVAGLISLSDEGPDHENVTMVATAGISIGHVCDLVVYYKVGEGL